MFDIESSRLAPVETTRKVPKANKIIMVSDRPVFCDLFRWFRDFSEILITRFWRLRRRIKSARSNGVFIYFGLCFGLLQTNKIIKDNIELLEESRKEFSKIMKEIFLKGQEIDVIVFENTDKRISLTWDIQSERNKKLYENINTKFNLMISSK